MLIIFFFHLNCYWKRLSVVNTFKKIYTRTSFILALRIDSFFFLNKLNTKRVVYAISAADTYILRLGYTAKPMETQRQRLRQTTTLL